MTGNLVGRSLLGIVALVAVTACGARVERGIVATPPPPSRVPDEAPVTTAAPESPSEPPWTGWHLDGAPPQAPSVETLKAALSAEGYPVRVDADANGVVSRIDFKQSVPTKTDPLEVFVTLMKEHGDALGYGRLGDARASGTADHQGTFEITAGEFPKAERCPGLAFAAAFAGLATHDRAPFSWVFQCKSDPSSVPVGRLTLRIAAEVEQRRLASAAAAPPVVDGLKLWIESEKIPANLVKRSTNSVFVQIRNGYLLKGSDRQSAVRTFAERAAKADGLPALDTVSLEPATDGSRVPAELAETFQTLTLRLARPPLDGSCIDPRVEVTVFPRAGAAVVTSLTVECGHEPSTGNRPPAGALHAMPAVAGSSLPFVAICESISWAVRNDLRGTVIDKRGDVYSFHGGHPFSGTSGHELAVLLRHEKHYEGSLRAADVDRLAALAWSLGGEQAVASKENDDGVEYDAPFEGCSLLRGGTTADSLVAIPVAPSGKHRIGPASSETARILAKASALHGP